MKYLSLIFIGILSVSCAHQQKTNVTKSSPKQSRSIASNDDNHKKYSPASSFTLKTGLGRGQLTVNNAHITVDLDKCLIPVTEQNYNENGVYDGSTRTEYQCNIDQLENNMMILTNGISYYEWPMNEGSDPTKYACHIWAGQDGIFLGTNGPANIKEGMSKEDTVKFLIGCIENHSEGFLTKVKGSGNRYKTKEIKVLKWR